MCSLKSGDDGALLFKRRAAALHLCAAVVACSSSQQDSSEGSQQDRQGSCHIVSPLCEFHVAVALEGAGELDVVEVGFVVGAVVAGGELRPLAGAQGLV